MGEWHGAQVIIGRSILGCPEIDIRITQRSVNDVATCFSITDIELAHLGVAVLALPHFEIPQEVHTVSRAEATKQSWRSGSMTTPKQRQDRNDRLFEGKTALSAWSDP